jgi:hypothetical protein
MTRSPDSCQYPLIPWNKFARGLPTTTYGIFAKEWLQLHKKGQPLVNTSEESKIQS